MPDLLKIGMTERTAEERARELSQGTGVPFPFRVAYSEEVPDCAAAEQLIHARLDRFRTNKGREFFNLPLRDGVLHLMQIAAEVRNTSPAAFNCEGTAGEEAIAEYMVRKAVPVTGPPPEFGGPFQWGPKKPSELVAGPANAKMVWGLLGFAANLFIVIEGVRTSSQTGNPEPIDFFVFKIVCLAASCLAIWAGFNMIRLKAYKLSIAGGIAIMPGACICCLAGMPIGIWSLVVLSLPQVRSAFR
jgi:hypothetical protein